MKKKGSRFTATSRMLADLSTRHTAGEVAHSEPALWKRAYVVCRCPDSRPDYRFVKLIDGKHYPRAVSHNLVLNDCDFS